MGTFVPYNPYLLYVDAEDRDFTLGVWMLPQNS